MSPSDMAEATNPQGLRVVGGGRKKRGPWEVAWKLVLAVGAVASSAFFLVDRAERPAASVDARVDRLEARTDAQIQVVREELRDLYRATLTGRPQPRLESAPVPVTTKTEP